MRKTVLIVEKNFDGHRLYYVRLLVEHAQSKGFSIALMLARGVENSPEYNQQVRQFQGQVQVLHSDIFDVVTVEKISREVGASEVIVPDGDTFAIALALRGGWRGEGVVTTLIMREIADSKSGIAMVAFFKRLLKRRLIAKAARARCVRVVLLKSPAWRGNSPYLTVTDPVTISAHEQDISLMRQELELSPDRYWFGIMGRIDWSKRPMLIAQAIAALPEGKYGLAIVGKATEDMDKTFEEIRLMLDAKDVQTLIVSRVLDDKELDAALSLVDCHVIIRSNEAPSAMLGKTLALGKKSIVAGTKALHAYSQIFPENVAWARLSQKNLTQAMQTSLTRGEPPPYISNHNKEFVSVLLNT